MSSVSHYARKFAVIGAAIAPLLSSFAAAGDLVEGNKGPVALESMRSAPENVDMHFIFAIDLSRSVNPDERVRMLKSFAHGLISQDSQRQFDSGPKYALSVIYFGWRAEHTVTHIVENSGQAAAFANEVFWDFTPGQPRPVPDVGDGTMMNNSFIVASKLIENEAHYGFSANTRAMIVVGDGVSAYRDETRGRIREMAENYNTVVSGVPILAGDNDTDPEELVSFYRENVPTPPKSVYMNGKRPVRLRPGAVTIARSFDEIGLAVEVAMRLSFY